MVFGKHLAVITALALSVATLSMSGNNEKIDHSKAVDTIGKWYVKEMARFDSLLSVYPRYFYDSSFNTRLSRFEELTRQVKKIEGLFIYFHPKLAYQTFFLPASFEKQDFGPPLPDNWIFLAPYGVEPDSTLLKFKKEDSTDTRKMIERSVAKYRSIISSIDHKADVAGMTEADLFEALRLEMMRISTMGIGNADFVVEQTALPGLEGGFTGWSTMMNILLESLPASMDVYKAGVRQKLHQAEQVLEEKPLYKTFDRLEFLTRFLVPLANDLYDLQKSSNIKNKTTFSSLNDGKNIYEAGIFNPEYFASGKEAFSSPERVKLGRFLFFDPILSDNNERACASCHKPELAFTDGNIKSLTFERGDLPRNSPTVINAVFQKQQFWDLRASSLEDQLDSVINSKDELHSSFENVVERINSSPEYRKLFHAAFPESKQEGIKRAHVKIAIACYERELTGLNSRFDQYIRGEQDKMNQSEKNGFNLFVGKAKCATCHYAPLFSSAIPPYFEMTDHRSLGVPMKDTMEIYALDGDVGAFKSTNNPFFNFSFKIPTVRNAALTAPYMHNGVYKTLEQVVDFYNEGAGNKFTKQMRPGMKGLPFFMILPEKLDLSKEEKTDLVNFMKALTDTTCTTNVPKRLPAITGKHARLNKRVVGGVY